MCLETLPAGWHGTPHNFIVCVFASCPVVNISTIRVKKSLCIQIVTQMDATFC